MDPDIEADIRLRPWLAFSVRRMLGGLDPRALVQQAEDLEHSLYEQTGPFRFQLVVAHFSATQGELPDPTCESALGGCAVHQSVACLSDLISESEEFCRQRVEFRVLKEVAEGGFPSLGTHPVRQKPFEQRCGTND